MSDEEFTLEMCEQPIAKKPRKHKAKDVNVQYRCQDTEDWVDMLNIEDSLGEGLKVIHNPINSVGKGLCFSTGSAKGGDYIVDDDWTEYVEQMRVDLDNQITGAGLKFIGIDDGIDITNDLNSLIKEKYFKPKEKQIENNAWNGGKNKSFSGYKSYY